MNGSYVLNSLIWSFVGGLIGYQYCKMKLDVTRLKRHTHLEDGGEESAVPTVEPQRLWFALHRPTAQNVIGLVVILMAVISIVSVVLYIRQVNAVSKCLTDYQAAYNNVLRDRDQVSAQSRDSLRGFIIASDGLWKGLVLNAPPPGQESSTAQKEAQRAASLAVLNTYFTGSTKAVAALDAVDQARQKFPLPVNLCGDPSSRNR
jgi:hypothetical protein